MRLTYLLTLRGRFQNRELDLIGKRDALTGLCNRRSLEEAIAECEQVSGIPENISIVLIDIDHFKKFNDMAGPQAGDMCLRRVANIVQGELRDRGDKAFRYGGEEFLVLLIGEDLWVAREIAERMRRAVEGAKIPHPGLPPDGTVTASFGVASAIPAPDVRIAEIIEAADTALYAAKREGRNRVWPRPPSAAAIETIDIANQRARVIMLGLPCAH